MVDIVDESTLTGKLCVVADAGGVPTALSPCATSGKAVAKLSKALAWLSCVGSRERPELYA